MPIDSEGYGKWGLGGNEGVAPSFPKWGGIRSNRAEKAEKVGFAVHRASFVFF